MLTDTLIRRILETAEIRGFSPSTARTYVTAIRGFARHHKSDPSRLGGEDARDWLLALRRAGRAPRTLIVYRAALGFFFDSVLGLPTVMDVVPRPRTPHPDVVPAPTVDEVRRVLAAATNPVDVAFFSLLYGTGMRIGETCRVQVAHIDRANRLLHVPLAKGGGARSVPLTDLLIDELTTYWRAVRPRKPWLFPSRRSSCRSADVRRDPDERFLDQPVSCRTMQRHFKQLCRQAGLRRVLTPHDLRHAYATHQLEHGTDLRIIQVVLGHAKLATTAGYAKVSVQAMRRAPCALSRLAAAG